MNIRFRLSHKSSTRFSFAGAESKSRASVRGSRGLSVAHVHRRIRLERPESFLLSRAFIPPRSEGGARGNKRELLGPAEATGTTECD